MKKTIVTETALREFLKEVLDDKEYGSDFVKGPEETPVIVDNVVDPSESQTDPGKQGFSPQNSQELTIAINQIVKVIPDESIGPFYQKLKQITDNVLDGSNDLQPTKKQTPKPVKDEKMKNEQQKVEETIRKAVRKILIELNQANNDEELGPTGDGTTVPENDATTPSAKKPRKAWGAKASSGFEKKELVPFNKIAADLDMSTAGAKQAVDKAWRKGRFIDSMYKTPEDKQKYVADLVNQYIEELSLSGNLEPEDIELLELHPDMVVDLEGFQDFMKKDLEDAGYYPDIEFDEKGEPIFRDPGYEFDQKGSLKK